MPTGTAPEINLISNIIIAFLTPVHIKTNIYTSPQAKKTCVSFVNVLRNPRLVV